MRRITAIVADPSRAGRLVCSKALQDRDDIVVVKYAGEHDEALAAATDLKPRILLCSRRLALPADYLLFENLRERCPLTLGVLWSEGAIEDDEIMLAFSRGVVGFVEGPDPRREMREAIYRVDDGEAWVRRRILGLIRERVFM